MDRQDKDFSVFVSNTLDTIGYSQEMVKTRRELFVERFKLVNQNMSIWMGSRFIVGGSKGEGISRLCESDIDAMYVDSNILCCEDVNLSSAADYNLVQLDRRHTAPGYTRLSSFVPLPGLVISNEGIAYIPNTYFARFTCKTESSMGLKQQGPALCMTISKLMSADFVPSYRCHCPSILNAWLTRRRRWNWPTQHQLREISTLDAHVVAVGHKRSPERDLEWRICFTLAELALVRSLNDTQTKLYILLKFMAKSVLKPVCGGMTSYVMKNIVLWMTELTHPSRFTPELLVDRLIHCLKVLSIAVYRGCLPSYIIPERNLLSGTMRPAEKKKMLIVLRDLINEGGGMLLRCEKLSLALMKMYKTPEIAKNVGGKLDRLSGSIHYFSLSSVHMSSLLQRSN